MSHIIVIRRYRPGDELGCREIINETIMFIFFGMPFTICFFVIPIVVIVTYIATYLAFMLVVSEINQEISNIPRIYMSNAFSCFWVAESFEPLLMTRNPKDIYYTVMNEKQFRESNIDVSSQAKKIVGTIGLLKSHKVAKGAWIKRLCVHKNYQQKGVGSCLLSTAVQFAIDEGYSCADLIFTEYNENYRKLYNKKGFELKQMYHKPIIGPIVSVLIYELSYQIKPEHEYVGNNGKRNIFRTE
ncbi:hypothetical protein PV327_004472 [Microctonus hyperodae]|uniref:N-acetyltransferase domain-containing protein n=1 Tax=Microctonus hyperodae TaxID=165561 RepID=A0AA39KMK3_MICHY|nr:hypothetical protein PV327_004472 [Microctonus hyperodae]